jgi:hypothetical protein
MRSTSSVVLHVLAHHAKRPIATLRRWHALDRDLDMTPLEIVLVALEIEDILDVDLDVDGLDRARTVGELANLLSQEVARAQRTPRLLESA